MPEKKTAENTGVLIKGEEMARREIQTDMTAGSPFKIILNFTIPIFIGNVFQQFYNMADTIIVGKFVGTGALAAVGSVGTIVFLIIGFLQGLTAGFSVLTAQRFGAGDMKNMRKSVGTACVLSVIITVIMTAGSMLGMKRLLEFMNTPEDIFADAYAYIMIICGGIAATVLYNLLSGILRALGDSKTPLYFLILSALLNVGLDLFFIIVFHMGVAGAAYATVISQGVSGIGCLIYIVKKVPLLKMQAEDFRPEGYLVKMEMAVGIPMALQYSITAIGTMMVQSSLNLLGSLSVAAFTAANKIESVVTQAYVALGTTMATYCAQNIGAGDIKRIRRGFKSATIYYRSGGYLSEMCGTFPDPSDSGQCLPERDPGHGLRTSAYDGRRCRASGKGRSRYLGFLEEKLCRGLYGQPGSLDPGREPAAGHVFLDHEETEPVSGKVKKIRSFRINQIREYLYIFLLSLRSFEPGISKLCQANSHKMYKYS